MRVTLKLATSLDGKIAMPSGESQWITGTEARAQSHQLRSEHDAVLVGSETVLADDPMLTVRLDGYAGRQPIRVVLDSRLRLPLQSALVTSSQSIPTWVITGRAATKELTDAGVKVISLHSDGSRPAIAEVLEVLENLGIGSIMVEGGGQVAGSFLKAGRVDRLEWFRAPLVLGAAGRPGISDLQLLTLSQAPRFVRKSLVPLGQDIWERYEKV
jgi:diaminohydroxyphosphoribosylaminopyrimidine deaminase/5-amino-6-(5-phosphoribosylamino)uracil reductase